MVILDFIIQLFQFVYDNYDILYELIVSISKKLNINVPASQKLKTAAPSSFVIKKSEDHEKQPDEIDDEKQSEKQQLFMINQMLKVLTNSSQQQ